VGGEVVDVVAHTAGTRRSYKDNLRDMGSFSTLEEFWRWVKCAVVETAPCVPSQKGRLFCSHSLRPYLPVLGVAATTCT